MKSVLILLLASCEAVNLRSPTKQELAEEPVEEPVKETAKAAADAVAETAEAAADSVKSIAKTKEAPTKEAAADPCAEALEVASTETILRDIHTQVESCDNSGKNKDLKPCDFEDLLKEIQNRKKSKECAAVAPPPAAAPVAAPVSAPPLKNETSSTTTTTTTSCPDNFMDELVDQANVEFQKLDKDGDGCISHDEASHPTEKQVEDSQEKGQYYWNEKDVKKGGEKIFKKMEKRLDTADKNGDGCVSKDEIQDLKFAICDCGKQFAMMDQNGDGKISMSEGAQYVEDHMGHADLSYGKFKEIFDAADKNEDKYLSLDEFCKAGPRYKGDGNNESF